MEVGSLTLYAIIVIVLLIYFFVKQKYEYWNRRNIPFEKPHFMLGNLKGLRDTVGIFEIFTKMYTKYRGTGPFAGFWMFTTPSVVLLDLDLIKNVLIKDFNLFDDRGLFYNERDDPLTAHLFALDGAKWRPLRGKLTPTFTSGKMKFMFPTMIGLGEQFVKVLEEESAANADVEVREILARFTTDVIGTCAFGIECNSLKDPNAEFKRMGQKAFQGDKNSFYMLFTEAFPRLSRLLHIKRIPHDITHFYTRIVRETVEYREKNNIRRHDFMDILIDLKNKQSSRLETGEKETALTMNEIIAQSFVFFLAGFETSSTTMSFALYELAQHQDIQDKLRNEINDIIDKHNGEMSYEGMKEMRYLDMVIHETLRKFSPASNLRRCAKEEYPTSDPNYIIPKGANVIVPIFGIQNDPEIYPNPHVFDPERFSPDEVLKRHPMAWLPFGDGPRNCIGMRFGKMQARVGLAMLIKNFKFSVTSETPIPMVFSKKALVLTSDRGIVLNVEKI